MLVAWPVALVEGAVRQVGTVQAGVVRRCRGEPARARSGAGWTSTAVGRLCW